MRKENSIVLLFFVLIITLVIGTANVLAATDSASSDVSFCCEKTNDGAWCLNEPESECNPSYNSAPTSCETTSYCKLGTCYDSDEGICMKNTAQRVCNDNGGTWDSREIEEVPQCQLGCCIVSDQAAFVSLVRCKKLSTEFGVEINYRTDINNEVSCIAEAQAQDVGACVYEKDFERTCEFTTRGDCGAGDEVKTVDGKNITLSNQKTFYKDFLCSAEELNTACAKQVSTTCYQGDVFWVDSCGNRENVYSDDKVRSWGSGKVVESDGVCNSNDGSDVDCGNCDYLSGSRCSKFDGFIGGPKYGNNYCQKTECVDRNGNSRINGESWCVNDGNTGNGGDKVGSRYFKESCVDGDVRVEPCADFRNEVCLENSIGDFGTAACRVNRWQDCIMQDEEDNCLNIDRRDCVWMPAVTGMIIGTQSANDTTYSNPSSTGTFSNPTANSSFTGNVVSPVTGQAINNGNEEKIVISGVNGNCVPNFPPGFKFWEDTSIQQVCGQANAKCVVVYEKGLLGGLKITKGKECMEEQWALSANRICVGLGDCGGYVNYKDQFTDDGYKWIQNKNEKKFTPNSVNIISGGFTGMIIAVTTGKEIDEEEIGDIYLVE